MLSVTLAELLQDDFEGLPLAVVYVIRDGETVFYVGRTSQGIKARIFGHLGLPGYSYGASPSPVGRLIWENAPGCLTWQVEHWTVKDCLQDLGQWDPRWPDWWERSDGSDVEGNMIRALRPCLNYTHNENGRALPETYRRGYPSRELRADILFRPWGTLRRLVAGKLYAGHNDADSRRPPAVYSYDLGQLAGAPEWLAVYDYNDYQGGNMSRDIVLTERAFNKWLSKLTELYPEIDCVLLVGSRASGYSRPDSDWDVVICLEDNCYQDDTQVDKIEQRIAFDPALCSDALDIFWLRPSGSLGRWEYGPDEAPPSRLQVADSDEWLKEWVNGHLLVGEPMGDFDRLYRSLDKGKILYDKHGA